MSMNKAGRGNSGNKRSGNRAGQNRAGQGRTGAGKHDDRRHTPAQDESRSGFGARGANRRGGAERTGNKNRDERSERQEFKRGGGGETRRNARGHERNRRATHERQFSASAPSQRSRMGDSARTAAFEVLLAVATEDSYANLVLPKTIRDYRLDARDAGFATELTYGTLRNQGTYDAILAHCVDRPVEKIGTKILLVLRLGVHQLLAMRVPDHAALNQTVALARAEIGSGPANFVNAVLRRVSERSAEDWHQLIRSEVTDELKRMALEKSHPAWVVRSFRQALAAHGRTPAEIEALLDADNAAPIVNLVELPGLGSLDEAREKGATDGELVAGSALYAAGDLARLETVREGTVRAQDAGSQLVARALAFAPLEGPDKNWLDLCAGPGGKAALLGAIGAERGVHLLANEAAEHRAHLVEQSLKPLPAGSYKVVAADGRQIAQTAGGQLFDRVMVDVPCSGLGALRRRPEARWRKTPRDIAELLPLQLELFQAAASVTRPDGLIAYVTCSPHAAETQNIVHDILRKTDVELIDSGAALRVAALTDEAGVSVLAGDKDPAYAPDEKNPAATTGQLWPHVHGTDAMFFALFRKK
ncbi:MAG: transcription antitermination factor NusB [Rothia sp. (in: high G+C Gram-positive bacteria)]|nr:transcription antitermination factor NusB [Rothia sp. (in: high G+C Gram-positive bacteria)]